MIVHGFAGIGWSEALRQLGMEDVGLELDTAACRTRTDAGHRTIQCDVTAYPTWVFKGRTDGKIDSPVCPPFGKSGKKLGLRDLPLVHQAIEDLSRGKDTRRKLDAADFGAGQVRKRAFLIASRVRDAELPAPTHGGLGQPPHTAMADTVGWGYTRRPAPTVTGGGTATGGAEPFGNGTRQAMRKTIGTALWRDRDLPHLRPTVAECAALQGFRSDLNFHGRAGQQYLQVGNSLAVAVAVAVAVIRAAAGIGEQQLAPLAALAA